MILKLDHIAYTCGMTDISDTTLSFAGYEEKFYERNLKNPDIKTPFLRYGQDYHDIIYLDSENGLPIEITAYKEVCDGAAKYDVADGAVIVNTSDVSGSGDFYSRIGFKRSGDNEMSLKTVIDKDPVLLKLRESENRDHSLDTNGYCCIAFIVNNIEKERKRLSEKTVSVTEVERIVVNGSKLDIFFAYNEYGDICEYICTAAE